ncbi:hypothetical protein EV360DRAFT_70843 [Lentinula raphanica]|nr:hypothetical protein EV360DRAFT_70843 [Lentinula raphanica]
MAPGSHPPGLPSFTFTDITPTWPTVNARRIDRIWPSIPDWNFDAKFSVSPNNIIKGPLCYQTQSMIVLRYGVFNPHSMGFAVVEFGIMDHARMQVPVPVLEQQNEGDHESLTFFQAPILQIFSDPSRFLYTTATSEQQSDGYDRFVGAFALIDRSPDDFVGPPCYLYRRSTANSVLNEPAKVGEEFVRLKAFDSLPSPALTRLGKVSENTGWASKLRHTLELKHLSSVYIIGAEKSILIDLEVSASAFSSVTELVHRSISFNLLLQHLI